MQLQILNIILLLIPGGRAILPFTLMRSLLLEEFINLAPDPGNWNIREIYHGAFRPQHITAHFEGWEYDASCGCFIDATEDRNMVWFGAGTYFINGRELRWPPTLNDFILDCRSLHIPLRWSEGTADKLWFTPPGQLGEPWSRAGSGHNGGKQVDGEDDQQHYALQDVGTARAEG